MNTYSDQRTDGSVFGTGFTDDNTHGRLCDLSGDHLSGDLDTIASGSRGSCDGIASGSRVCGVCNVDLGGGIASSICTFDGGRISCARIFGSLSTLYSWPTISLSLLDLFEGVSFNFIAVENGIIVGCMQKVSFVKLASYLFLLLL